MEKFSIRYAEKSDPDNAVQVLENEKGFVVISKTRTLVEGEPRYPDMPETVPPACPCIRDTPMRGAR